MTNVYKPTRYALPERTDPAVEPVGLEEMKAWARIDNADDDATIVGLIRSARRQIESLTHRAFITQTATYHLDRFPDNAEATIELPGGTLQSITSIQYVDTAGATQTWASSNYVLDTGWNPGRVSLAFEKAWPAVREWNLPVTITYVVGYGDDPGDVPEELRTAIKILAADLYENREDNIVGAEISSVHWGVKRHADPYRIHRMI